MKASEKFKLCPSCDGKAPLEVVICPYCASSFSETNQIKNKASLSAAYSPPYAAERVTPTQNEKQIKQPASETLAHESKAQEKSVFLPIALLTIGSNLLLLSLLLLFLGKEGKLELEWSSDYWLLYLILSVPMLFLGYKIVKKEG